MGKKLDRFLLCKELAENFSVYRHWVGEGGLSNHFPVFLEMKGDAKKPGIPFKFNSSWLNDESYEALFHATWRKYNFRTKDSRSVLLMNNLKNMKHATKEWALQKKLKEEEELKNVNSELECLENFDGAEYASFESRSRVKELEASRRKILQLREESWQLKS